MIKMTGTLDFQAGCEDGISEGERVFWIIVSC